jgi:arsenite oxidase large subunit
MLSTVNVDGLPHHVLVLPDPDATVVNVGGDYGLGASLAKKLYSPESPSDRLTHPELRTSSGRIRIDWDAAIRIIAEISAHVVATSGPLAWGMKAYSYQFYENTYAITKLALKGIMTPCWAPHDKPAEATDAPGLTDAGIDPFSAAYQDWKEADVLFLSGVSLYEAHPVLFTQWVMNGPKVIVVNPRRDPTAAYAEANGGMHLAIQPGTDTLLHNSIAWVILSEGWEDTEFITESCADEESLGATSSEFDINDPNVQSQVYNSTEAGSATLAYLAMNAALKWRRVKYGQSFEQYRNFILENAQHDPANAGPVLGISPSDIRRAATLMAAPGTQGRPKTSLMLEKGNYWAHNYPNTASLASLGLLLGAGNRPGRMISRAGGHQRGMISGGKYPFGWSPHAVDGNKVGTNLDHWMMGGNLDFCWVIGTTWVGGGTASAQAIFESLRSQTTDSTLPQVEFDAAFPNGAEAGVDVDYVVGRLKERIAGGGLVLVDQDIYPQPLTEVADLVLPAASWGEEPFARMQGERRLRFYPRIADPPGEAKPDWWIVAAVARRLGLAGFDWRSANEVFEAAGEASRGGIQDYWQLVRLARERGRSAHDLLAELGTTGIQCPIRREGEELAGTLRLHETGFATPTGRALFVRGDWTDAEERQVRLAPREGELWIVNRRVSGVWNSMVEDLRNPYRASLWSENYVELNPGDAESLGVTDGQAVLVETQGVVSADLPGGGPASTGSFSGTARVTDRVPGGIAYVYFNYGGDPAVAANNVVTNEPDPINGLYSFKLGRGRIRAA